MLAFGYPAQGTGRFTLGNQSEENDPDRETLFAS